MIIHCCCLCSRVPESPQFLPSRTHHHSHLPGMRVERNGVINVGRWRERGREIMLVRKAAITMMQALDPDPQTWSLNTSTLHQCASRVRASLWEMERQWNVNKCMTCVGKNCRKATFSSLQRIWINVGESIITTVSKWKWSCRYWSTKHAKRFWK